MRALRILLAFGSVTLLSTSTASAVDGVIEISHTRIIAAGGYPYMISAPGSYVLTSNLTATAGLGGSAIDVGADNVEINLNGFTIVASGLVGAGISDGAFPGSSGTTVRNGVLKGFGVGIAGGKKIKLIDLSISGGNQGVIGVSDCLIRDSQIFENAADGISVAVNCKIENNVIADHGGYGIASCFGCEVSHNTIIRNGVGIAGSIVGLNAHENTISQNTVCGICDGSVSSPPPSPPPSIMVPPPPTAGAFFEGTVITANQIGRTATGYGIFLLHPAVISDNTVTGNFQSGSYCGYSCTVRGNVVEGNNTGGVLGHGGVLVGPGSTVTANSISSNLGFGLTLPPTSGYTNNTMSGNGPGGAGPDVITPPSLTGALGNNCSGVACP